MSQYPSENISFFSEQEDYTAKKVSDRLDCTMTCCMNYMTNIL